MIILKIGGGNDINLEGIARDLSEINDRVVIVIGANSLRDEIAELLGIKTQKVISVSGYSSVVSGQDLINLQMMVYAGLRSKRFVELCQQNCINAIGLSGVDGGLIRGKRNNGMKIIENNRKRLVRDYSGKPEYINLELLNVILNLSMKPVVTVPIMDELGYAINAENDEIVYLLQKQTGASRVIHLIEAPGVLRDPGIAGSVIPRLTFAELIQLEENADARFKRKLLSLRRFQEGGECKIIIADGRVSNPLIDALSGKGTVIE